MQVLEIMSHNLFTIPHNSVIKEAALRMRDQDIGILPVANGKKIVGTITDRDITIRAVANGNDPNITPVENVMSKKVYACQEDDNLKTAAQIMEKHQVRRLLVKNGNGEYTGVLSLADLARHHESEQFSLEVLEEVSHASVH